MVRATAILICLVFAWSASYSVGSLTISPNTSPLWLRTESILNLTCTAYGRTEISWYKNGVMMNIDSRNGFMMTTQQTVSNTISNLWKIYVGISDAGMYSCRDNQQRHLQEEIDVRVLNVLGSDVTKPVGHSATLRCNPQNLKHQDFKRIEWRRNYGSLPPHQLPRVIKNDNSFSLQLNSLEQSDTGDYECIFTFETKTPDGVVQEMSLSKNVHLEVQGNPIISPSQSPVRVLAPGTITLTCKVEGDTNIEWKKDDNIIQQGGNYNITILKKTASGGGMESISTLNVLNPTASDKGLYTCYGKNLPSKTEVKIVTVLEVVTTDSNLTIGSTAVLRCEPQYLENADKEKLRFQWTVNGGDLPKEARFIESKNNFTLEIQDLRHEDAGQYECVFSFADGESQTVTKLVQPVHLYAAPYVQKFEKSKNMVQGDTLKLKCRVSGHPTPQVVWKRDDVEIDSESSVRININDLEENGKSIGENGLLTIFELQFEDRAVYKCEANNTMGSDNSTIKVRVKDKLAALWPFLGIVAEVAILCTIIFIYEKRRSKDTEEEEDAPLQKTANAQDHKGKDEVRQRKP